MLDAYCKFLFGLGDADDGVETVLTPTAFDGLIEFTKSVYGEHAAKTVENCFTQREDGSLVCCVENMDESFRLCLTGKG